MANAIKYGQVDLNDLVGGGGGRQSQLNASSDCDPSTFKMSEPVYDPITGRWSRPEGGGCCRNLPSDDCQCNQK